MRTLKEVAQRLKNGEYDGADIMQAWTALADAERYRWLRGTQIYTVGEDSDFELRFRFGHLFNETLDKAIDREIAEQRKL